MQGNERNVQDIHNTHTHTHTEREKAIYARNENR
jgi:hypothetical protein